MAIEVTYKHQIAIDLFMGRNDANVFWFGAMNQREEEQALIRKWFSSDIVGILLLYTEEERIEVLREFCHFLERIYFDLILDELVQPEPKTEEEYEPPMLSVRAVERAHKMLEIYTSQYPVGAGSIAKDDPRNVLEILTQYYFRHYMSDLIARIKKCLVHSIQNKTDCRRLLEEEFGLDEAFPSREEYLQLRHDTSPRELLKVDIGRVIRAFENASQKFNPELFAASFGLEYDNSMKRMKTRLPQKNERIVRIIEELTQYISPEEKTKLAAKLRP